MIGKYYSQSKRGYILYRDMDTKHLYNALSKIMREAIDLRNRAKDTLLDQKTGMVFTVGGRQLLDRAIGIVVENAYPIVAELVRRDEMIQEVSEILNEFMGN